MIVSCRRAALGALLTVLCLPAASLHAQSYSALAFDNGTIQPGGPRPFSNGKNFFNMEGINNNNFSSFGVADFHIGDLVDSSGNPMPSTPTGLNSITITLTQANASFTTAGMLNFYLAEDTTTSIQPNDAAVIFDLTDPSGEGLNGQNAPNQLSPLHLLGSGMFTGTPNPNDTSGTMDTFTFPADSSTQLDAATVAYVLAVFANADPSTPTPLRIVVTPPDPSVAATYAGYTATMYNGVAVVGPTLTLNVSFN